jgi:hypothetical protein
MFMWMVEKVRGQGGMETAAFFAFKFISTCMHCVHALLFVRLHACKTS